MLTELLKRIARPDGTGVANATGDMQKRFDHLVDMLAPRGFDQAKWRLMTWPGCPACRHPPGIAGCTRPRYWLQGLPSVVGWYLPDCLRCPGDAYLNIETGIAACRECRSGQEFSVSPFACHACGAMFRGGEVWQGMEQDLAEARQWPWMRTMKARTTQEIFGCGWQGATRLAKAKSKPRCGCPSQLYVFDGSTEICGNCLQRWSI